MPPLTKWQKQAKQQRASSAKCFNNALIEDLLEVYLDPDYLPETNGESDTDSNSDLVSRPLYNRGRTTRDFIKRSTRDLN